MASHTAKPSTDAICPRIAPPASGSSGQPRPASTPSGVRTRPGTQAGSAPCSAASNSPPGANSTKPPPALRKAAPETGKRLLACLGSARVLQVVQPLGDRALAVGGLVLVDDALARRLVELARSRAPQDNGLLDVAGVGGHAELANGRLQRRAHRLVALPARLVLQDALLLRLDVRHAKTCSSCF